jgi:hypothetical protein
MRCVTFCVFSGVKAAEWVSELNSMKSDGTLQQFVDMVISSAEPVKPPPLESKQAGPSPVDAKQQENPLWSQGRGDAVWAEV